jgi:NADPH:quinone reductase-like Zn-dependent oxidoreductase
MVDDRNIRGYRLAMRAVYGTEPNPDDPLSAATFGDRPEPESADGWVRVQMRAGSLNRHDLWTLRGVGIKPEQFPMILGCDGAGVLAEPAGDLAAGTEVVIYPVIADATLPDETLDPKRTLFTELHSGLLGESAVVPLRNVLPKPASLSFEQAATLGCTYLTAYRMLFTRSGLLPGQTMLVQGASGGVSTALIQLGTEAGLRVWVTGRNEEGRSRALQLGAAQAFEPGTRLPERVDGAFETVGEATWSHSMKSVRPGGVIVCSGATTGAAPSADLQRLFFLQISVIGSTMGTLDEMRRLIAFCDTAGIVPVVDRSYPLAEGPQALQDLENGAAGKLVLTIS